MHRAFSPRHTSLSLLRVSFENIIVRYVSFYTLRGDSQSIVSKAYEYFFRPTFPECEQENAYKITMTVNLI